MAEKRKDKWRDTVGIGYRPNPPESVKKTKGDKGGDVLDAESNFGSNVYYESKNSPKDGVISRAPAEKASEHKKTPMTKDESRIEPDMKMKATKQTKFMPDSGSIDYNTKRKRKAAPAY